MKQRILVAAGLLALAACDSSHSRGPLATADSTAGNVAYADAAPAPSAVIDAARYAQLRNGMSYKAAVAIIGSPGVEQSSSDLAGIKTAMYSWQNSDGTNASLMFQNGRLAVKSQFGLK